MVSNISQGTGSSLFDTLRSMQKEQEETLEGSVSESLTAQVLETASAQSSAVHAASSNLMSRKFASAEREESKYIKARQAGQEAVNKQASRQIAILNAGLSELNALSSENTDNYAVRNLIGRKAARRMLEEGQQTVREESERNLKEIKENIEERTQEAAVPKDKNGNPIETGLPAESAGEAAPMPEISGSNPASAPEVSAAPAPDVAAVAVSTPEVSTPSAPATPSIDITV